MQGMLMFCFNPSCTQRKSGPAIEPLKSWVQEAMRKRVQRSDPARRAIVYAGLAVPEKEGVIRREPRQT